MTQGQPATPPAPAMAGMVPPPPIPDLPVVPVPSGAGAAQPGEGGKRLPRPAIIAVASVAVVAIGAGGALASGLIPGGRDLVSRATFGLIARPDVTIAKIRDNAIRTEANNADTNADGMLSAKEADAWEKVSIEETSDLSELGDVFPKVRALSISAEITTSPLTLSGLTALESVRIDPGCVDTLDISGIPSLKLVDASDTQVEGLDALGFEAQEVIDSVDISDEGGNSWSLWVERSSDGLTPAVLRRVAYEEDSFAKSSYTTLTFDGTALTAVENHEAESDEVRGSRTYDHDSSGRVTGITIDMGGAMSMQQSWDYDSAGRVTKETGGTAGFASSTDAGEEGSDTTTYEYEGNHLVSSHREWTTIKGEPESEDIVHTWDGECAISSEETSTLTIDDDGPSVYTTRRTCDAQGRVLTSRKESDDGFVFYDVEFTRDEAGNVVEIYDREFDRHIAHIDRASDGSVLSAIEKGRTFTPNWSTVYAKPGTFVPAIAIDIDYSNSLLGTFVAVFALYDTEPDPTPYATHYARLDSTLI